VKELDPYEIGALVEEAAKPELDAIDRCLRRAPESLRSVFRLLGRSLCEQDLRLEDPWRR
jgi:hypothetical protein